MHIIVNSVNVNSVLLLVFDSLQHTFWFETLCLIYEPLFSTDMFNITNMRGKVAKFCIFKTVYRLGEEIVGTFNFSEGDIPCLQVPLQSFVVFLPHQVFLFNYDFTCDCLRIVQYSVSLQSEEEIQEHYQRRPGQPISVSGHGRHLESCLHTASSHFSLPIPLNVTPGFSTDIGRSPVR